MAPELVSALKRWRLAAPKGEMDLVFPNERGGPLAPNSVDKHGLHPALRRAGLRRVHLHWLRHGYGSILISSGVSPKVVQLSMGHSSIQMTLDVYGHLLPGDNATAAAAISRALASSHFLVTSPTEGLRNASTATFSGP